MSFSKDPSTRPEPDASLPEEGLERGLRAALRADDDFLEPPSGVLDALERLGGRPSRVFLAEPERQEPGPVIAPAAPADGGLSRGKGQYRVDGELARGGMGVVLKGHDTDLGRDVALKVMHPEFSSRPESVQRFVEEAQIGGQLQHPGIVPVYELGLMADERPYFAMKLIKGRTLASLFADRASPASDPRRFLGIFEQVCQTVAYAHARGVIHRDLKPSNVMVGSFGEVQVVDWGLAKVLPRGGVADEKRADKQAEVSVIETVRSEHGSSHSRVGSVMGTPAYMAPEQARGEVGEVDERSDVFSLGAILCELLTGAPPYTGDRDAVLVQAAGGELQSAKRRLDACEADRELVELAVRCLAPAPNARPRNAEEVATGVQAYLTSVEERAREARLEAERARARAAAEHKARRLTVALATTVLIAILGGGGGYVFVENQRQARRERVAGLVNEALNEATARRAEGELRAALAAAERARALANSGDVEASLRTRVDQLIVEVDGQIRLAEEQRQRDERNASFLARLDEVRTLERLETLSLGPGHELIVETEPPGSHWERRDEAYAAVFEDFGIPVTSASLPETADLLRGTGIGEEIALRLDDWARVVRALEGLDSDRARGLLELAHLTDADPEREALRSAVALADLAALRRTARELPVEQVHPISLVALAGGLDGLGATEEAVELLEEAQRLHPDDFTLNHNLGVLLGNLSPPRREHAVRFLVAAVAAKPDSRLGWFRLGLAHERLEEFEEAIAALERALAIDAAGSTLGSLYHSLVNCLLRMDRYEEASSVSERFVEAYPEDPAAHGTAAILHRKLGDLRRAREAAERAVDVDGQDGHAHAALADALIMASELDQAVPALRRAIELRPPSCSDECLIAGAADRLARAFHEAGRLEEAVEWYEERGRLVSDEAFCFDHLAEANLQLGNPEAALEPARHWLELGPEDHRRYILLAKCLRECHRREEAVSIYEEVLELEFDGECADCLADAIYGLGWTYLELGREEEAEECFAGLTETHPEEAKGWHGLGRVFELRGELSDALDVLQRAREIAPDDAAVSNVLGNVYFRQGDFERASAIYRRAYELEPNPIDIANLAMALRRQGRPREALVFANQGIEAYPRCPEGYIQKAEALIELGEDDELPELLERMIELADAVPTPRRASYVSWVYSLRASRHAREGRLDAYREEVRGLPDEADIVLGIGRYLDEQDEDDRALEAYLESYRLDPENESIIPPVMHFARRLPQDEVLALEVLTAAVRIRPDDIGLKLRLARRLTSTSDHEWRDEGAAIDLYREVLQHDPENVDALDRLAWRLVISPESDAYDPEQGLEYATLAVERSPDDGHLWNTLGVARYRVADWSGCVEALERSIELEAAHPSGFLFLAMAWYELGEEELARQNHERAKSLLDGVTGGEGEELARLDAEARALLGNGGDG